MGFGEFQCGCCCFCRVEFEFRWETPLSHCRRELMCCYFILFFFWGGGNLNTQLETGVRPDAESITPEKVQKEALKEEESDSSFVQPSVIQVRNDSPVNGSGQETSATSAFQEDEAPHAFSVVSLLCPILPCGNSPLSSCSGLWP